MLALYLLASGDCLAHGGLRKVPHIEVVLPGQLSELVKRHLRLMACVDMSVLPQCAYLGRMKMTRYRSDMRQAPTTS